MWDDTYHIHIEAYHTCSCNSHKLNVQSLQIARIIIIIIISTKIMILHNFFDQKVVNLCTVWQ